MSESFERSTTLTPVLALPTAEGGAAALESALQTPGLSTRVLAEQLMGRDQRTIRRWRAGQIPIPPQALSWLQWFVGLTHEQRMQLLMLHGLVTGVGVSLA